jgi:hypothetical protein
MWVDNRSTGLNICRSTGRPNVDVRKPDESCILDQVCVEQLTPAQNEIIAMGDGTGGARRGAVVTTFGTRPFRVYALDPRPSVTTNRYLWSATLPDEPLPRGISKIYHRFELTFLGLSLKVREQGTDRVHAVLFDVHGRQKQRLERFEVIPTDAQNEKPLSAGEVLYDFHESPHLGLRQLVYDDDAYSILDQAGKVAVRITRDRTETRLENDLFVLRREDGDVSVCHLLLTQDRLRTGGV